MVFRVKQTLKHNHKIFNRYTVSILAAIVIAAMSGAVWLASRGTAEVAATPKSTTELVPSRFSFEGASGWWQGATNETSMALFHDHDCFISVQYKVGTIDIPAALQKDQTSQAGNGGKSTPTTTLTSTLRTATGLQQYDLHQYTLTAGGENAELMQALELGYLQLSDGYVKIEGHCNTPDELPVTLPALQAITLSKTSS